MPSLHKVSSQEPAKVEVFPFLDSPDDFYNRFTNLPGFFQQSSSLGEGTDPLGSLSDFETSRSFHDETTTQPLKMEDLLDMLLDSLTMYERQELLQSLVKCYGYRPTGWQVGLPISLLTGAMLRNYLVMLIYSTFPVEGYVAVKSQDEQEMAERMVSSLPDLWKISLSNQILGCLPYMFHIVAERHRPRSLSHNVYYLQLVCESLASFLSPKPGLGAMEQLTCH